MNRNQSLLAHSDCTLKSSSQTSLRLQVAFHWTLWTIGQKKSQWESEYRKHLNTEQFEVQISNGLEFKRSVYLLCTLYQTDQHIRNQDGVYLSGIQMAFRYRTIRHLNFFQPFKYQTSLVFRSPLYVPGCLKDWSQNFAYVVTASESYLRTKQLSSVAMQTNSPFSDLKIEKYIIIYFTGET